MILRFSVRRRHSICCKIDCNTNKCLGVCSVLVCFEGLVIDGRLVIYIIYANTCEYGIYDTMQASMMSYYNMLHEHN